MIRSARSNIAVLLCVVLVATAAARAADTAKPSAADARLYENTVNKAIEFFRATGQAADGSYSAQAGPAVTALVTTAILKTGRTADDPLVAKSLKYVLGFVRPDGGIYAEKSAHQNYETCLAIQCLIKQSFFGR